MANTSAARAVDCNRCRHFHITHDRHAPYGCHALSFKSKQLPSRVVWLASGEQCLYFAPGGPRARAR